MTLSLKQLCAVQGLPVDDALLMQKEETNGYLGSVESRHTRAETKAVISERQRERTERRQGGLFVCVCIKVSAVSSRPESS